MFTAAAPRAPQLTNISPAAVAPGGTITLTGTQLRDAFPNIGDRDDMRILDVTDGSMTVQLSRLDVGGTVTVQNSYGRTGLPIYVGMPPTINSFTPDNGVVGDQVIVTGTGFTGATVAFNGTTATAVISNDTQLTATVPPGATTGPISVTNPLGTATSATPFTINGTSGGGCGCHVAGAPSLPGPLVLLVGVIALLVARRRRA
jgi:MYXO-CTERM domain-containing protein